LSDDGGCIPLHHAAYGAGWEAILAHHPELQLLVANDEGKLPLHEACSTGKADACKAFLAFQPEKQVLHQDYWERIPLFDAARDSEECVRILLAYEGEKQVLVEDEEMNIALHGACEYGEIGVVEALLQFNPLEQTMHKNGSQELPIQQGVDAELFQILLEKGSPDQILVNDRLVGNWAEEEEWFDLLVDFFVRGILTEEDHLEIVMSAVEEPEKNKERLLEAIRLLRAKKSATSSLGKRDREGADLSENPRDTKDE